MYYRLKRTPTDLVIIPSTPVECWPINIMRRDPIGSFIIWCQVQIFFFLFFYKTLTIFYSYVLKSNQNSSIFYLDNPLFRKKPDFLLVPTCSKIEKGCMVFCYQNCSDLLWEKIVLVIENNFSKCWDHWNNLFKQWKVRTIFGNRMLS